MKFVLQQKQQLNLSMTAELGQAIELLQYSTYELAEYMKQQELENPLIELKETVTEKEFVRNTRHRATNFSERNMPLDAIPSQGTNQREEVLQSILLTYKDHHEQQLLKYILHHLDDYGYLHLPDEAATSFSMESIEKGIHLLQRIGPLGIGARSLKESLLLQIAYTTPHNQLAENLVNNCLELVVSRKWEEIAEKMDISLAKVKELYEFIQTLNPRPCTFSPDFSTEYITPDIIVTIKNDELVFQLNDGYLPMIQLNNEYLSLKEKNSEVSSYINTQYNKYQWLVNSIEQRRNTIIKITKALLMKQEQFFKNGLLALKPLTMKEIADMIEMHESTISRATRNKTIQTPFGSFELSSLFTSKISRVSGDNVSQTQVKTLLQDLIENENKQSPYSDQKITNYFKEKHDISISRRTVAKYRQELNIPSSSKRKEIVL